MSTKEASLYDILIRVPDAWTDKTLVIFEAPPTAEGRYAAKVVVSRHARHNQSIQDVAKAYRKRLRLVLVRHRFRE